MLEVQGRPKQIPHARDQPENDERYLYWRGSLQWQDKQLNLKHIVAAEATTTHRTGLDPIDSTWPSTLNMELMPEQIIGNIAGGYYLKNSKTVLFHVSSRDLEQAMEAGFGGVICLPQVWNPNPWNIKILFLLRTEERTTFIGFIPNNQAGFLEKLVSHYREQLPRAPKIPAPIKIRVKTLDNINNEAPSVDVKEEPLEAAAPPVDVKEEPSEAAAPSVEVKEELLEAAAPSAQLNKEPLETAAEEKHEHLNKEAPSTSKKRQHEGEEREEERASQSELEAVGVNVSKKLKRMENVQRLLAEALINKILIRGLFGELEKSTEL